MNFKEELTKRTEEIEVLLKKAAPKEEGYQKTIFEAMNYTLSLILAALPKRPRR